MIVSNLYVLEELGMLKDCGSKLQRGYVSRKKSVLDGDVIIAEGIEKGKLYHVYPSYDSTYYSYRHYFMPKNERYAKFIAEHMNDRDIIYCAILFLRVEKYEAKLGGKNNGIQMEAFKGKEERVCTKDGRD